MQWSIRRHLIALVVMVLVPTPVFSGFTLSYLARVDREEKNALHIAWILPAGLDREATTVLRSIQTWRHRSACGMETMRGSMTRRFAHGVSWIIASNSQAAILPVSIRQKRAAACTGLRDPKMEL